MPALMYKQINVMFLKHIVNSAGKDLNLKEASIIDMSRAEAEPHLGPAGMASTRSPP